MQYIPARGNLGDAVIAAGVSRFVAKHPEQSARVLFRGGAFEPHSDILVVVDQLPRNTPLTILPSTFGPGTAGLLKQFRDHQVFCRDVQTLQVAKQAGLNAVLEHDMAFGLDYSAWKDQPSEGVLRCFRGDMESTTNFRPADNRDLSLERQAAWTLEDCDEAAKYFIGEIAKYAEIHTDRLHVAIVGTLLGKRVKFYSGLGWKNQAIYEYSLKQHENCTFHDSKELTEAIQLRAMVIHQGSRMDRKDNVMQLFKDVGNCGVFEAIAPDWDTPANRAVRGCSMSHLQVIRWHMNTPIKWLLVLEDDAVALPAFREQFLKLDPATIPADCAAIVIGGDVENVQLGGGNFMKILPPFWGSHGVVYNMDLIRKTGWLVEAMFIAGVRQLGPDHGPNGICYESLMLLASKAVGQNCYRMREMSFTTMGGFSARSQTEEPPRSVALSI